MPRTVPAIRAPGRSDVEAVTRNARARREGLHADSSSLQEVTANPVCPPNVLTLSCKNRPPCGAHRGAVAAATERAPEGAMCGRRDAVQFGAAQGGSAAGPTVRRFLSACEGC